MDFFDITNQRYLIAGMFILAGFLHFVFPTSYERIIPAYIPYHRFMVWASGIAEIVGGLFLLFPTTQTVGGWWLIAVLIAVFPANLDMFVKAYQKKKRPALLWLLFLRLPLQGWLIYWVYLATEL